MRSPDTELLRLLVENVTDYAIFVLDPEGHVASWNPGAARIKGYAAEEILGRHFSTFYPQEALDRGWPAHELRVAAAVGRFEDEGWRLRKDGSRFWANVVITALRDETGQLRGFAKITRDLTARKQAEENDRRLAEETAARKVALEERERLRVTLASIGDAVISTDREGRVEFLNPVAEALVGWSSGEAAGQPLERVFPIVNEETRRPVENPALRALREGVIVGLANHTVLIARDGTERPIDDSAAPIRTEVGDVGGSVLVFRDISERKRAERYRNVRLAASQALTLAATTEAGATAVLAAACGQLGWEAGHLWVVDEEGAGLVCRTGAPPSGGPSIAARKAWATGEPAFHVDAAKGGPRAVLACPVRVDQRVLGVIELFTGRHDGRLDAELVELLGTIAASLGQFLERRRAEDSLREQAANAETLLRVSRLLAEELDLHRLVQTVTDASTGLCGARFGAFFYNVLSDRGEAYTLYTLSGARREDFAGFPMPRNTAVFGPTFRGEGVVRLADVTRDPRYGHSAPYHGMPAGHPPLRSYLAVPVISRAGEVLGGLFFGHPEVGVFTASHERLIVGIAGQAAVAIDNARLHQRTQGTAERLQLALQAADLGDWSWDAASDVVSFSPRAAEVFGIPPGPHMTWTAMLELLHDEDRDRARQEVARVIAERSPYDLEYRVQRPDGSQVWVGVLGRAVYDDRGAVTGMHGVVQDVTARRNSEAELREAKRRFQAAFDQQFQFMAVLDPDGRLLEANETWFRSTGFRREDVLGRPFWDAPWWAPFPAVQAQWRAHIARAVQSSAPVAGEVEYATVRGTSRHATSVVTGLRDETGRVTSVVVESHDDTERKRAEAVRGAQRRALELLVHGAPLPDVLDALCQVIETHAEDRVVATVLLVDEDGQRLRSVAGRRAPADYARAVDGVAIGPAVGSCGTAAFRGEPVVVTDIASDPLWKDFRGLALAHGLRACWSTPILSSRGTVLGTFAVYYPSPRGPLDEERRLVEILTSTASVAIERRRDEAALRASEARFRGLMEQAPFSVQLFSPDGRTTRVNRAWEDLWGLKLEQLAGYNVLEDRQLADKGVLPYIQRAFAGESTFVPAVAYDPSETIPGGGRGEDPVRWVGAVAYPLKDEAGAIREVVLVHEDTTARRKAEAALRDSEEKLRFLADTIPQLAWMARPDGQIFWYNRRWYEYTGTRPDQMEGWDWQSVHDPEWLPRVTERWRHSLTTGEPFDMVFPMRGADGVMRPFLTRANPLRNEEGRILYWFGTNTDITELREAREALATSEERLRLALEAGQMGVWDWNVRTGELEWSDSLEPLHGLEPGTFGGTFEHFQELVHPDDRAAVTAAIQRALAGDGEYYIEFRNLRRSGAVHWIAGSGKVFHGEDGQPLRMIGIGLDVTPRKHAEQTARFLADASAALAVLVDFDSTLQKVASLAVPHFADWAAVDVLDDDGSLRRVAVAHVDPARRQLAQELHRRFPPDPGAPTGAWNIVRTGQAQLVPLVGDDLLVAAIKDPEQLRITRELGLRSYIGVPLVVRGKPRGVLSFVLAESGQAYDETDLAVATDLANRTAIAIENAQLYRELREADRRKDEFLATLAHELRNPLAPIRNGLQVLRLAGGGGETGEQARTMMERQLAHMVRLVDDLMDVSRITRNRLELRKERVALSTVVLAAIETSRPLLDRSGHVFTTRLPPEPVYLDADPVRLAQVFANLLNNAAKYTEPGGTITLTAEVVDGEAVVRVRDNGLGIPAEAQARVFEMFSQVDRNMGRAQGGLGIGLTLVRRLAEMHGGTVSVASDGPGRGSEFTVRIPLPEAPQARQERAAAVAVAGARRRILVVDDNTDAAETLGMMLTLMGHEVREVHDGHAAVAAAEDYRPDLVLLDIGLPGIDGHEVCRRIRAQGWSEGVVIVALTGWGQDEDRRRSQEAGFDHHLVKPVESSQLARLLAADVPVRLPAR